MQNYRLKFYLTLILLFGPAISFSAEDTRSSIIQLDQRKAQEPISWIIWKDQIKPGDQKIYEDKILTIIKKARERPDFIRILTFYESATASYYYFYPFLSSENWDKIYTFWSNESNRAGTQQHLVNYSILLTKSFPKLSHFPSSNEISMDNPNYVHMEHFQIQPDAEEKFLQLLSEWTTQTKAKAPNCGWFVQKTIVSENLPTYLVLSGDCLKKADNIVELNKFFFEKEAYGPIIKKIVSENKIYLPKLSTSALDLSGK